MTQTLPVLIEVPSIVRRPAQERPALSPDDAAKLAALLKALADPVRLRLLSHLLDQPSGEDCTCNLAPLVGLSDPTVSHHLKRLETSGLLTKERRGMSVYYRVVPEAIDAIGHALHVSPR